MEARKNYKIFTAVIQALFFREINMRITVSKSGVFWTFFEPFMQVLLFILIKNVLFGSSTSNIDYTIFLALNFTAYNLFRNILNSTIGSFRANSGLFVYKQVKPIDTAIARMMVELFVGSVTILIFVLIGIYFDYDLRVENLPLTALSILWLAFFAISVGLVFAVANNFFPSVGKIVGIVMYILLFVSGVFYTLDSVPFEIRDWLLINPVLHFMQMIDSNFFYEIDDRYVDYNYVLMINIIFLFIGMVIYRRYEKDIISR